MGYNSTATTLTLTAKLTPIGRQKLVSTNNALIKTFSLGDSDANYFIDLTLGTGQVPGEGGNIGFNNTVSNSTARNLNLATYLIVNSSGSIRKSVSQQSTTVLTETQPLGFKTISGSSLTINGVNRNNATTDPLVNLFFSFGLPLNSTDDNRFSGITYANGGFSDTAFSGFAGSKIVVIGIDNSQYGEALDGKTVKLELPTTAGTYTLYSTYLGGLSQLNELDARYNDTAIATGSFGYNVATLFSDNILTPNGGDLSLSWSTGYGTQKPFSINGKKTYNLQTNTNLGATADTAVGMSYLDKGFIVITDPTIVNAVGDVTTTGVTTGMTVTFDSISTNVTQQITCIADRGEFGGTTNPTFGDGDVPRISEVGLYDDAGNLIAYAKTDRQVTKNVNQFLALSINITL
jgi:hypothetical protein